MSDISSDSESLQQVLMVYLGEQIFGVPISSIQDVLEIKDITKVPLSASYIQGVMNLRGRIVTAISLRKRINFQTEREAQDITPMSVVIENHGELYSIVVDKVGDVLPIREKEIIPLPQTLEASWKESVTGLYKLKDDIMVLLDPEKIIHKNENKESLYV